MSAFEVYEHPEKPDLFRKKLNVDVKEGNKAQSFGVTLFADFRKSDTGQFWSEPAVAHEDIPLIDELKEAIMKLPENVGKELYGQEPGTTVAKSSGSAPVPGVRYASSITPTGLDMVIPTLGVTMRELGFISDIDYYISTDGYKFTLAKEGITKLAAYASKLPDPVLISDTYEEIEFVRDNTGQLERLRLKGLAWLGPKDNPLRTITDEIDWDWNSAMTRAILKNVKNGEYLRWQAENKKNTSFKDKKTIENSFSPDEITYNMDGTLMPAPDAPMAKIIPLMSYMADVREFALRTCIGKLRSRMWSELLGLRSLSNKEVEIVDSYTAPED
jgi:hypothetical protein